MTESTNLLKPEEVEFLLDQAGQDAEKARKPTAELADKPEAPVTMRGDLEQINLSDIFQTLGIAKMMGVLQVSNPLERRHVYFKDGFARIVVPTRVAIRRLGQRLVQAGILQPEQLRMALLEQRREPAPLGQILVQQGLVSEEQIHEVVGQQLGEELFALFTWRHGEFEFYRGDVTDQELRRRIEESPEFEINGLLLEVARRSDEWESIIDALGSLDEILARQTTELPDTKEIGELHRAIFAATDGQQTLREIAENNLLTLFDAARAARDLVAAGCLGTLSEEEMVAVAKARAEGGHKKPALMLVQALRIRPGEKSPEITRSLAEVMRACGEPRLAGQLLLETAQAQADPVIALELARAAQQITMRDAEVLSFLRTTLIAASSPDTAEVETVTLALLDCLIEGSKSDVALQIVEETIAFGTGTPQVLLRKVRALQRTQQTTAAVDLLVEIGHTYAKNGERARALDAFQQAQKLDRERKDVQKLLKQLTESRRTRTFRFTSVIIVVSIALGGVFEYQRQSRHVSAVLQATSEVTALVGKGDSANARAALATWELRLGACEPLTDLLRQIEYSEASASDRQKREERRHNDQRMSEAGRALLEGSVAEALDIYAELHQKPEMADQVAEVASVRTEALATELERLAKSLPNSLPPSPSRLMEGRVIEEQQKSLQDLVKPNLRRGARELGDLVANHKLPEFLPADRRARLTRTVEALLPHLDRAEERLREFAEMLARMSLERRLDPLLRSADDKERNLDFRGALVDYERLVIEVPNGDVHQYFKGKVARCRDIATRIENVAKATAAGDFAAARACYLAGRQAFPSIPFDRIMRLPLLIATDPPGALVLVNGAEAGKSPLRTDCAPASRIEVELRMPGFQTETCTIMGAEQAALRRTLARVPAFALELAGVVERAAAQDEHGQVYTVDRAGAVTAIDVRTATEAWRWLSKDLSGLLTAPLVHGDLVLVGSLDGEFRALRRGPGTIAWSQPGLPVECNPALVGDQIVLATTTRKILVLQASNGALVDETTLPEPSRTTVQISGSTVIVGSGHGQVYAMRLQGLGMRWKKQVCTSDEYDLLVHSGLLVSVERHGRVSAFAAQSGEPAWQRALPGEAVGQTSHGSSLFVALADRILVLDPNTGDTLKTLTADGAAIQDGPVLLTDGVLVRRRDGRSTAFSTEDGRTLFQIVGAKPVSGMTAMRGGILVTYADRRAAWFADR